MKGALSGVTQFWIIDSSLTMMKNALYFLLEALFVLKVINYF